MKAYVDDYRLIVIEVKNNFYNGNIEEFYLKTEKEKTDLQVEKKVRESDKTIYYCTLDFDIDLDNEYYVDCEFSQRSNLIYRYIVKTKEFENQFYTDKELGSFYQKDKTVFRLWAPTATKVFVKILEDGNYHFERLTRNNGIYEVTVEGDFNNCQYNYLVYVNGFINEVVDPYAISSTKNASSSVIVNKDEIKMFTKSFQNSSNPTIYELSVYDFTNSDTVNSRFRSTFKGLVERGIKTANNNDACFDYLCNLGITNIQLMPINNFATIDEWHKDKYNWGYDPQQFFSLQQSYFCNGNPILQINEFKDVVESYNENNIGVNVDVVFNHVYDADLHAFNKIVPYYYFRKDSNGSFCGNDIASEFLMVRKYIIDVVKYLFDVLQVDGLRFDLMGILNIDTINEIKSSYPEKMIYGEGWNMPTKLAENKKAMHTNHHLMNGVLFFNDDFRNKMRGFNNSGSCGVTLDLNSDLLLDLIVGKNFIYDATKSINYVECHDNYTLFDKMVFCFEDETLAREYAKFLTSITIIAKGITFLHSGQEFFRTKYFYDNTYNLDAIINELNWDSRDDYASEVKYIQGLLKVKQAYLLGSIDYASSVENGIITLKFDQYAIIINSSLNAINYQVNGAVQIIFNEQGYVADESIISTTSFEINKLNIVIVKEC